jgi:AbrB family looped-hinge helix DNA binding protein
MPFSRATPRHRMAISLSIAIDICQLALYHGVGGTDMKTTLDRFGRIVVPKEVRDRHGLVAGSEIEIEESGESILLHPVSELPGLVEKEGILIFRGHSEGSIDSAVRSHRDERLRAAGGSAR